MMSETGVVGCIPLLPIHIHRQTSASTSALLPPCLFVVESFVLFNDDFCGYLRCCPEKVVVLLRTPLFTIDASKAQIKTKIVLSAVLLRERWV